MVKQETLNEVCHRDEHLSTRLSSKQHFRPNQNSIENFCQDVVDGFAKRINHISTYFQPRFYQKSRKCTTKAMKTGIYQY